MGVTHADSANAGAFGGASYGATQCCAGRGKHMRTPPLAPSVEFLMGPGSAVLDGGDACGRRHWDL
eukprot:1964811-Pyramimonas_sp.AAC.1